MKPWGILLLVISGLLILSALMLSGTETASSKPATQPKALAAAVTP
jgi:hypothetical protein